MYGDTEPHRGCFGNLKAALHEYDIEPDNIPTCFNPDFALEEKLSHSVSFSPNF
jgi:uncharacterized protein YcgI (DUF1989 family)